MASTASRAASSSAHSVEVLYSEKAWVFQICQL